MAVTATYAERRLCGQLGLAVRHGREDERAELELRLRTIRAHRRVRDAQAEQAAAEDAARAAGHDPESWERAAAALTG